MKRTTLIVFMVSLGIALSERQGYLRFASSQPVEETLPFVDVNGPSLKRLQ